MDSIDMDILDQLIKNPQKPFCKIAKKIGVSQRTVQKKIEKMQKKGIILRFSTIIDLSKFGYQGRANLMITQSQNYDRSFTIDSIKNIPDVFLIAEITGEYDLLAIVAVRDYRSILKIVKTIEELPSVENVRINFLTDTLFPAPKNFKNQFDSREKLPEETH